MIRDLARIRYTRDMDVPGTSAAGELGDAKPNLSYERKIIVIFGLFTALVFGGLIAAAKLAVPAAPAVSPSEADQDRASTPATPIVAPDPSRIFPSDPRYDLDGDGYLDNKDLTLFSQQLLRSPYDPRFDIDGSTMIDMNDLLLLRAALSMASTTVLFDLTLDGHVDNRDVKIVSDAVGGITYVPFADLDASGVVDIQDLRLIRAFIFTDPATTFDLTLDGRVDNYDVELLAIAIGSIRYNAYADLDASGMVDTQDLLLIRAHLMTSPGLAFDLNRDGAITNDDLRPIATAISTTSYVPYADLDASGLVDTLDLTLIRAVIRGRGDIYAADLDVNGQVDRSDREVIERAIKSPSYRPEADLDASGRVDKNDLAIFDAMAANVTP